MEAPMRILLVMPRMRYLNPTTELILDALGKAGPCMLHGPGYVPHDELALPIPEVVRRHGPFDAVIVHQYLTLGTLAQAAGSCWFGFDVARVVRDHPRFPEGLADVGTTLASLCTLIDQYALPASMRDRLERFPGAIITWPRDSYQPQNVSSDLDAAADITGEFASFWESNARRIIPVHHVVDETEFVPFDTPGRNRRVVIPGNLYARRRDAVRRLDAEQLVSTPAMQTVLRLSMKLLRGHAMRHRAALAFLRTGYRHVLARASIAIADGSGFDLPVRKYFEVPAAGSALLAYPCAGIAGIGHIDSETFASLSPGDDVAERVRALLADEDYRRSLAAKGQAMVRARHTGRKRAEQIMACLSALAEGQFAGATWEGGELAVARTAT
jgi:hypothetical protein